MHSHVESYSRLKLQSAIHRMIQIKNIKINMYDNKESFDKGCILNLKSQLVVDKEKIFKMENHIPKQSIDRKANSPVNSNLGSSRSNNSSAGSGPAKERSSLRAINEHNKNERSNSHIAFEKQESSNQNSNANINSKIGKV